MPSGVVEADFGVDHREFLLVGQRGSVGAEAGGGHRRQPRGGDKTSTGYVHGNLHLSAGVPNECGGIALQVVARFLSVIHHVSAPVTALRDVAAELGLGVGHQVIVAGTAVQRIVHARHQKDFQCGD